MIGDPLASSFVSAARRIPEFQNLLEQRTDTFQNDVHDHMVVFARAKQMKFPGEKTNDRVQMVDSELMIDA